MLAEYLLPALSIAAAGLLFNLTVIVGMGPQNVVLLKQGVRRWGVGLVVSVFIIGDLILLPLGTAGVGVVVDQAPWLLDILRWAGVAYLLWFASTCLRDMRNPSAIDTSSDQPSVDMDTVIADTPTLTSTGPVDGGSQVATMTRPPRATVRTRAITRMPALAALPTALAVTFLNPAAWVDGVVVFGSMANQYGDGKWMFATGALVGSVLFFVAAGYGARLLSKPLASVKVWRWINLGIGLMMIGMAGRLAFGMG
ncbi:MAG: LysE/ArgO family amino acid transporter [Corynebacterium sp.]|uniref:LysE/ArgO family amino acid transporter n=1 Tax=Corynebacterium sp. TaxID=1720 RepID=UPI003F9B1E78